VRPHQSQHGLTSKAQYHLLNMLSNIFKDHLAILESKFSDFKFDSGHQISFDIFFPSLSLAFEYQGEQHYKSISMYGPIQRRKQNDENKAKISRMNGITLINIPFWWDKQQNSLVATILKQRPDLFVSSAINLAESIPTEIPHQWKKNFFKHKILPDI